MKDFIIKPAHLNRIELWAATTIFVFVTFFLVTNNTATDEYLFRQARMPFDYYHNYFYPQLVRYVLLYLTFLLLNFRVAPQILKKERMFLNIRTVIGVFMVLGDCFGVTDTHLKQYLFTRFESEQAFYNSLFQESFVYAFWLILMFIIYSVFKYTSVYLLSNSDAIAEKYQIITRDSLVAFVLWMISMFILLIGNVDSEFVISWAVLVPSAIFFYCYANYSILPSSIGKKRAFRSYLGKTLLVLLIGFIPVCLIILLATQNGEMAFTGSLFNTAFHLFLTAPLSWALFKRRLQGNEEITFLQRELGQTNANLDFLRSQINPHFLFNALNTIYATAINENAERTGEASEKLGDMMRFMHHENLQEKISLTREIEYLTNYIALQKLRTGHNPALNIETHIDQDLHPFSIAPMLLIPFVENAFKHGISFREASLIRISMEISDKTLNFDVYNTKHDKQDSDPEKNKSGIGLSNVKQRLQLLYPGKHDLIIRETGKEFFVHLTVKLT